jgi:hypothetical protein
MKYLVILIILQFSFLSNGFLRAQWNQTKSHYTVNSSNRYFSNINKIPKLNSIKDIPVIDSIITHNDQGTTFSYKYYYDKNGKATSYIRKILQDSIWENTYLETYSYDSVGNISRIETKSWNNPGWGNFMIQDYYYEKNTIIYTDKLFTINGWQNQIKATTFYSNGLKDSSLNQSWNDSLWVNSFYYTWNYLPDNLISNLYLQEWNGSAWVNYFRTNYDYNKDSTISSILTESWDGNNWNKYSQTSLSYSNNDYQIDGLYAFWDGTQWAADSRYTYLFNENNQFIYGKYEIFNNGTWLPGDGVINVTNPDGFDEHYLANEVIVSYAHINSINNEQVTGLHGYELSQNYPNPFNPNTIISYSLPSASYVNLIIYNILGQSVKTLDSGYKNAGKYSITFNAANLPSGIYFYKLEAGQFSQIKKMILVK